MILHRASAVTKLLPFSRKNESLCRLCLPSSIEGAFMHRTDAASQTSHGCVPIDQAKWHQDFGPGGVLATEARTTR